MPTLPTILVVDDEASVRKLLELVLLKQGFRVHLAGDGAAAVEVVRQYRESIDLALLDVQMPGLDGPQTLAALRNLNPELPCCFMSGHTGRYSDLDLLAMGAAHLFSKPFGDWERFVAVLTELLSGARRRRSSA